MIIRKYTEKDISEMVRIWNEKMVKNFHRKSSWMIRQGQNSLHHRPIAVLQIKMGKL